MTRTKEGVLAIDRRRFVAPRSAVVSRGRSLHPGLRYRGRRRPAVRRPGWWCGLAWCGVGFPAGQRDGAAAGMAAADVSVRAGFAPGVSWPGGAWLEGTVAGGVAGSWAMSG